MLSSEEREMRYRGRLDIARKAVEAAERVIMAETPGDVETLMWLTAEMAKVYTEKTQSMINAQLYRLELGQNQFLQSVAKNEI